MLPNRNQYVTIEENRIISPNLLNTAHLGFNRSTAIQTPQCSEAAARLTFVPGACPRISGSGVISDPSANFGPRVFVVNLFQYADTLAWTKGSHQLKFGGDFERFRVNGRSQISS